MEGFNAGTITIVLSIFGMGIMVMLFQWRQNVALEKRLREELVRAEERLREDAKSMEERLRGEMKESEERLREDVKSMEERLRGEIQAVAKSVDKVEVSLSHRLDRTDDKINALTQSVGVVQGAVIGVSVETPPREPSLPN